MKIKYLFLLSLSVIIVSTAVAQPKPKPKKPSKGAIFTAKSLRQILTDMQATDRIMGGDNFSCDPLSHFKKIPAKKKVPRLYVAARSIDTLKKRITLKLPAPFDKRTFPQLFDHFIHTDNHLDFVNSLFKNHKDISPIKYRDQTRELYDKLLPMREGKYELHRETYENKGCIDIITTSISYDPEQFTKSKIHTDFNRNTRIEWDVYSTIRTFCSCKGKGKTEKSPMK